MYTINARYLSQLKLVLIKTNNYSQFVSQNQNSICGMRQLCNHIAPRKCGTLFRQLIIDPWLLLLDWWEEDASDFKTPTFFRGGFAGLTICGVIAILDWLIALSATIKHWTICLPAIPFRETPFSTKQQKHCTIQVVHYKVLCWWWQNTAC